MNETKKVCGIVARNSIGYVLEVFSRLQRGQTVVTLRNQDDQERIELAGVEEVVTPNGETGWVSDFGYVQTYDDSLAQIQFTSGTEGAAKAIVLSNRALATTTDRLVSVMELNANIKEYIGVPIYYSFGFGRCRAISAVGGSAFIPQHGFDPSEVADLLGRGEINALSAVPSLLRLLLENAELFDDCGADMHWIEIGSQYMSRAEKESLKSLFPNSKIIQHYGLTEASRTTFLKVHDTEGQLLESVGQTYDDIQVDVDSNGRIRVKGAHTTSGMLTPTGIRPLNDEEGWLATNDSGHKEGEYLYFDGRMDDVINCMGIKLSPESLERAISEQINQPGEFHIAKLSDELRGEVVLVAHGSDINLDALQTATEKALRAYNIQGRAAARYFECDQFPVTETGKIRRTELSKLYQALVADGTNSGERQETPKSDLSQDAQSQALIKIWEEALDISPISIHDSFFDLGGDSLSAISVVMKFQKAGIPQHVAREILEGRSIAEIVTRARGKSRGAPLANGNLTVNAVRGFLVLCVIASHWMPGVIERIPEVFATYNLLLSPFYSAGTPGFAIIFGVGLGFAYLPRYQRNPTSVIPIVYRNAILLALGVLIIGGTKIAASLAMGESMRPVDYSNSFYGVLTYYLLAVLSIPIWLRYLSRFNNLTLPCLFISAGMYLIHLLIEANNPTPSLNPIFQTAILLATATFNYFELTAGVMAGLALGCWFRQLIIDDKPLHFVWLTGLLLIGCAAFMGYESGYWIYWFQWPKPKVLSTWFFYSGALLIALRFVLYVASSEKPYSRYTDKIIKILSIVGILAFPLFIGHEIVIPLRDLMEAFSIPGALLISLAAFFLGALYLGVKVKQLFFARELEPQD